jgi:hypothetical protein
MTAWIFTAIGSEDCFVFYRQKVQINDDPEKVLKSKGIL